MFTENTNVSVLLHSNQTGHAISFFKYISGTTKTHGFLVDCLHVCVCVLPRKRKCSCLKQHSASSVFYNASATFKYTIKSLMR